jgi:tetratricopeptide (TPR) repeat protein
MEYWQAEAKATECLERGDFVNGLGYSYQELPTTPNDYSRRYAAISIYIGKARSYLGMGDAQAAHRTLEELVKDDHQGIYMGYPEYFETLIECQKRLGLDCRNAQNQLAELELDWGDALIQARKLLNEGEYKESLIYFERSLNANPGEWYSMSSVYDALRGKAKALKKLGRHKEAEACLKKIPDES